MFRRVVAARATAPSPVAQPAPGPWTVEQAYAYCERIAREHDEMFPVASRFAPPHLRDHVFALYAFARTADDFADEPRHVGRRAELLDDWEEKLVDAYHGHAEHPVFVALAETAQRRDVPIGPLRDLLTAFRIDLTTSRYPTWEALRNYTAHAAHPIGRLLLYVFDYRDADLHRFADDLCAALQLAHLVQDVRPDLDRGRIYLPLEDLAHFGVAEQELAGGAMTASMRDLIRFQVARSRALFERGRPLCRRVGRDLAFELNLIYQGGQAMLDKIEAADFDVFRERPALSALDKAATVARSAWRRFPFFRQPQQP